LEGVAHDDGCDSIIVVTGPESLPSDLAAAHAMIIAERKERIAAETDRDALIAYLKLEIEKLRRQIYGQRSERRARLLDQMELQLEELEAAATEDELAAQEAAAKTTTVRSFKRNRPIRQPFPENIERERIVIPVPTNCPCCGGSRLSKLSEDVTRTLEEIPRRFKVIETVREKFTCRDCEAITQAPAPFYATPAVISGRSSWRRSCSTNSDNICR
jgi:transposase